MQILIALALVLFSTVEVSPRELPEWYRVYTFENSIIELNTNYVVFSNRRTERVRFRWSFLAPETLIEGSQTKYQSRLEEIECDCRNKRFRINQIEWLDADGKIVHAEKNDPHGDWRAVRFGSMMEKLFAPACRLIELRKRVPAVER